MNCRFAFTLLFFIGLICWKNNFLSRGHFDFTNLIPSDCAVDEFDNHSRIDLPMDI